MHLPRRSSLTFRLVAGAMLWIALALVLSGVALTRLFRQHVEANMEISLSHELDRLLADLTVSPSGALTLPTRLADPLFAKPYSGRYWQIETAGGDPLRSRSLWDAALSLPPDTPVDGQIHRYHQRGPENQQLLVIERSVLVPELPDPVRLAVASDHAQMDAAVADFRRTLAWSLGVLGVGLGIAVLLQVRVGLVPLRRLRAALSAVRDGRRRRVEGDWPTEVAPLVGDLNALLEHDAQVVERARTQASNLAHALKTPLSVLAVEAAQRDDPLADAVRRQLQAMRRQVDHHLARARAAGAATVPGVRTDALDVARQLARVLTKLHQDEGLTFSIEGVGAVFKGDRQDFTEMLGNLLDNAAKWARSQVRATLCTEAGRLRVTVDDDGPGLPPTRRAEMFGRGVRLDEETPGSGLGLAIVRDLAALYGGSVELADSPLGGLRVALDLPIA
ncbi:MAG TPA: sensor histidine kinase [Azospirillaceae bacterium]|nr:sensor histidine kinase [Azospirillaceae bacterium]